MKLARSRDDRWIAGVCGGLAEALNVQTVYLRLAFALFVVVGGSGVLAYLVLWALMPRPEGGSVAEDILERIKR